MPSPGDSHQHPEQSECPEYLALEPHHLDALASACGRSAAPVFRLNGWKWGGLLGDDGYEPDAVALAMTVRRLMGDVALDYNRGTGRLFVYRWIEDGKENVSVSLELGHIEAEGTKK